MKSIISSKGGIRWDVFVVLMTEMSDGAAARRRRPPNKIQREHPKKLTFKVKF